MTRSDANQAVKLGKVGYQPDKYYLQLMTRSGATRSPRLVRSDTNQTNYTCTFNPIVPFQTIEVIVLFHTMYCTQIKLLSDPEDLGKA